MGGRTKLQTGPRFGGVFGFAGALAIQLAIRFENSTRFSAPKLENGF